MKERERTLRRACGSGNRGVTLLELMIGISVISVVAISTALVYMATTKALVLSKSRGIASRLAQDKFETLRGISYDLLLVTPQSDLDVPPGVDLTNYPPENFSMGSKTFRRSTIISRVYRDSSDNIVALSPEAADTGLKQIKVLVEFAAGAAETRTYTILITDPGLVPLDATLWGAVTDSLGQPVANAKVFVTQNQNWAAMTTSTGGYQIQMDTKTYTVTATKPGYWDTISASITPVGMTQLNLQMQVKATGTISGVATARPSKLLISGVFAGAAGADPNPGRHFLELYNPTTYPIMITDGISAKIKVKHVLTNGTQVDKPFTWSGASPIYVPSERHFLIATDSPTINDAIPDALFTATGTFSDLTKAGAAIQDEFGVAFDTVGWTNDGSDGPAAGRETSGVVTQTTNFGAGGVLGRKTSPTGLSLGIGNSYDSGVNSNDVLFLSTVAAGFPRNSANAASPVAYGVPASSAAVLATDGFSAGAFASSTGYYLLNGVTTGTWSVAAYWTSYSSLTAGNIVVASNQTTALDLLLAPASGGQGGVSGTIRRSDTLAALGNIVVSAGIITTLTDALGSYILSLPTGTHTITANPDTADASYNVLTTTSTVPEGGVSAGVNFNLVPSGRVSGKVTTNGTDAYPNIPVHALSSGYEVTSGVTDSGGNFALSGIPVGNATIEPILDSQAQTSSPVSRSTTVTQGTTISGNNFIVSTSLGKISGTVKSSGEPITTGVLVVASTSALNGLPTVDDAFRSGGVVLYGVVSDSAGQYSLTVARNSTYTVYGYFTSVSGANTTSTAMVSSSNVFVTGTATTNLSW